MGAELAFRNGVAVSAKFDGEFAERSQTYAGTGKVRFPAAVKVGVRIRGRAQILETSDVPGGVQIIVRLTIEIEGGDRPACVADTISRFYF